MKQIIKVRFIKDGAAHGRAYSYYAEDDIEVGDIVQLPISAPSFTPNSYPEGVVIQVGVPEEEVASFKDSMKKIIGKLTDDDQ